MMDRLEKKFEELINKYEYDGSVEMETEIQMEVIIFIEKTYPKIKKMHRYVVMGAFYEDICFICKPEFKEELLKHYPEEFV